MEKVLHPDCNCGQPVMFEVEMIPVFEDGIQVAMQQGSIWFHTRCEDCDHRAYVAGLLQDDEDELPF